MKSPETAAKGDAGSAGTRSGVPAAASAKSRTTIRRASSILKPLSPEGFASASAASAARRKSAASARVAGQDRFRFAGPPGFHGNAAERETCFHDRSHLRRVEPQRLIRLQTRMRCVRELSDNGHGLRNAPPREVTAPRQSSRRAQAHSPVPASRQAIGEAFRAEFPAVRLCLRLRQRRRARPGARRNQTGVSRCSSRSTPGWREACCRHRGRHNPNRVRVYCRRSRRRRNMRSAFAVRYCRRPWQRSEAAPMRRTRAPRPPPESVARSRDCARGRHCGRALQSVRRHWKVPRCGRDREGG